jgi:hypothetical protein
MAAQGTVANRGLVDRLGPNYLCTELSIGLAANGNQHVGHPSHTDTKEYGYGIVEVRV